MPLAIDLFCGLSGWSSGLVAEGWGVIGVDLEDMHAKFGLVRPPEYRLVIQDVLTLHGSQLRTADLIVASPPCQKYSYMAMPWSRAKAQAAAIRADTTGTMLEDLNRLFNACFRIQAEASLAAGRRIPLIVENVKGAQPWVGRARYNFGSFYLWGDVPALMPKDERAVKLGRGLSWSNFGKPDYVPFGFNRENEKKYNGGPRFAIGSHGQKVTGQKPDGQKVPSESGRRTDIGKGTRFTMQDCGVEADAVKIPDRRKAGGDWFGPGEDCSLQRRAASGSASRKFASAMIAKIPEPLSRHIGRTFR